MSELINDPRAQDLGDTGGSNAPGSPFVAPQNRSLTGYDHESSMLGAAPVSPKVERLIDLALRGALPRNRTLHAWEPDKLNARHVGCVLLKAAGYRQNRISELMGYTATTISVVLNHPDARTILAAVLAEGAKQAIDYSSTLQAHVPAMMQVVLDVAETPDLKPETKLKAAFGWLGMYERDIEGKKGKEEDQGVKLASEDALRIEAAIRESAGLLPSAPPAARDGIGSGSGVASPETLPGLGSLLNLPSDTTDSSLELTAEQIKAVLDERAAELEAELEQRLAALGYDDQNRSLPPGLSPSAEPSFSPKAAVRNEQQVSNSELEDVA